MALLTIGLTILNDSTNDSNSYTTVCNNTANHYLPRATKQRNIEYIESSLKHNKCTNNTYATTQVERDSAPTFQPSARDSV